MSIAAKTPAKTKITLTFFILILLKGGLSDTLTLINSKEYAKILILKKISNFNNLQFLGGFRGPFETPQETKMGTRMTSILTGGSDPS
ncbi:MAG: hypothetical protein A3B70_06660 [Deltaproteobacteria bacterium RIFCSPHIGHO2_02_FULL_40_11]|nr:MAG: hypothetical protein A3B70_06660 [Deltaproteobacteria bacterium RIFCSPHIGHO2_02_FULL_40_11]